MLWVVIPCCYKEVQRFGPLGGWLGNLVPLVLPAGFLSPFLAVHGYGERSNLLWPYFLRGDVDYSLPLQEWCKWVKDVWVSCMQYHLDVQEILGLFSIIQEFLEGICVFCECIGTKKGLPISREPLGGFWLGLLVFFTNFNGFLPTLLSFYQL